MGVLHARYLEPEALREHLRAAPSDALERTADTGVLDDEAALALTRAIVSAGEFGGSFELDGDDGWEQRFLLIASLALADDALAWQLMEGGWLDRRGVGARAFGALPLRIIQRQLSRESLKAAREAVQHGWESELVNLLESSALRAERAPEEHVVLVREALRAAGTARPGAAGSPDVGALLAQLRELGGNDLTLTVGLPPTAHGPFGSRALSDEPLTPDELTELLRPVLEPEALETRGPTVHSIASERLGRFRLTLTTERTFRAATFRALPRAAPALDALGLSPLVQGPLLKLTRGLVLLSGEPGSGRTTLLAALLQRFAAEGRHVASLEEPLGLPLTPGPGAARQFMLGSDAEPDDFVRATKLMPLDVVGIDLVDDALGLELALDAAMDGRLVFCVFRAPNVTTAVHRASVLDARFHRRRLAEGLSAFSFQRLLTLEGRHHLEIDFHVPSVALRRHLRAHETPPPPIAFETEQVG
ncbi:MAG: ATPase, T2SS/T4P/T4SS family [Myxococcota bacterium]